MTDEAPLEPKVEPRVEPKVEQRVERILDQTYAWSRNQGWQGWNKHDGLNSPILNALFGHWDWLLGKNLGRWPRMIAIQGVMRFPINLRPWLLSRKSYNPKGLALFTQGLLDRYRLHKDPAYLQEAEDLLDLLLSIQSPPRDAQAWSGSCWGYHYPWQDPGFFAPTNTPNAVVTAHVCEAFLDAWRITGKQHYFDTVASACEFFLNDLTTLKDTPEELCVGYMPVPMSMRVMDVSILLGSVLAQVGVENKDDALLQTATRLVRYVVNQQTEEGAWFYTDPPGDSHIRHDNYHTGFILDALERFMAATGNREWQGVYDKGLTFYAEKLFNADGSPRWMSHIDYPHDIHGAAQGIITFSRHRDRYPELTERILDWSIKCMYNRSGRFYYQQGRHFTKRFTLLRWANGWMCRAMAYHRLWQENDRN